MAAFAARRRFGNLPSSVSMMAAWYNSCQIYSGVICIPLLGRRRTDASFPAPRRDERQFAQGTVAQEGRRKDGKVTIDPTTQNSLGPFDIEQNGIGSSGPRSLHPTLYVIRG